MHRAVDADRTEVLHGYVFESWHEVCAMTADGRHRCNHHRSQGSSGVALRIDRVLRYGGKIIRGGFNIKVPDGRGLLCFRVICSQLKRRSGRDGAPTPWLGDFGISGGIARK